MPVNWAWLGCRVGHDLAVRRWACSCQLQTFYVELGEGTQQFML